MILRRNLHSDDDEGRAVQKPPKAGKRLRRCCGKPSSASPDLLLILLLLAGDGMDQFGATGGDPLQKVIIIHQINITMMTKVMVNMMMIRDGSW